MKNKKLIPDDEEQSKRFVEDATRLEATDSEAFEVVISRLIVKQDAEAPRLKPVEKESRSQKK